MNTSHKELDVEECISLISLEERPYTIHQGIILANYRNLLDAAQWALDSLLETLGYNPLVEGNAFLIQDWKANKSCGIEIKAVDGKLIAQLVGVKAYTSTGPIKDPTGNLVTQAVISESTTELTNPQRASMQLAVLLKGLIKVGNR